MTSQTWLVLAGARSSVRTPVVCEDGAALRRTRVRRPVTVT